MMSDPEVMQCCNMDERTNEEKLLHQIEHISRLNTALTLQNERMEEKLLLLMDDIDVLNSIIREAIDGQQ